MAKAVKGWVCTECGGESPKWTGRCSFCDEWGTVVEFKESRGKDKETKGSKVSKEARPLHKIAASTRPRLKTGLLEFDRLLGGGIVPGAMILCAGDPGIGKSTLNLIIAKHIASAEVVLYVSGEESEEQTKMRADRLGVIPETLYILADTDMEVVTSEIVRLDPALVVVDSIQTMVVPSLDSAAGSVTQVRQSAQELFRVAKEQNVPMMLVGQVTKESQLAGPRILEHMVDTVLSFEGNRSGTLRLVRCVKNRFGSTDELAMFEMKESGLSEVLNPSAHLLEERVDGVAGSVVVASGKGSRPIYAELQALVSEVPEGVVPRHMAVGVDRGRLELVAAVLGKYAKARVMFKNLFLSLAGGFATDDPALDLGIAVALLSSERNFSVPQDMVFIGEITLAGQVRSVPDLPKLLSEAARLGLAGVMLSRRGFAKLAQKPDKLECVLVENITDVVAYFRSE